MLIALPVTGYVLQWAVTGKVIVLQAIVTKEQCADKNDLQEKRLLSNIVSEGLSVGLYGKASPGSYAYGALY